MTLVTSAPITSTSNAKEPLLTRKKATLFPRLSIWEQVQLVLWKNWVLKKRKSFSTLAEILLPTGFILLLLWLKSLDGDQQMNAQCYTCPQVFSTSPSLLPIGLIPDSLLPPSISANTSLDGLIVEMITEGFEPGLQTVPPFLYLLLLTGKLKSQIALAPIDDDPLKMNWIVSFQKKLQEMTQGLNHPLYQDMANVVETPICPFANVSTIYHNASALMEYIGGPNYGKSAINWESYLADQIENFPPHSHSSTCPNLYDEVLTLTYTSSTETSHDAPVTRDHHHSTPTSPSYPKLHMAFVLHQIGSSQQHWEYSIHTNVSAIPLTYRQQGLTDTLRQGVKHTFQDKYMMSGFLTLQLMADKFLIDKQVPDSPLNSSNGTFRNKSTSSLRNSTIDVAQVERSEGLIEDRTRFVENNKSGRMSTTDKKNPFTKKNNSTTKGNRDDPSLSKWESLALRQLIESFYYTDIFQRKDSRSPRLLEMMSTEKVIILQQFQDFILKEKQEGSRSHRLLDPLTIPLSYAPNYIRMTEFPTEAYLERPFFQKIKLVFANLLLLTYIWPISRLLRGMVYEKEARIREGMYMMGLHPLSLYLAWFITYAILFLMISLLITLLSFRTLFSGSDPFLVFALFFFFGLSIIGYCFMVSVFFRKAKTASTAGVTIFFMGFLGYFGAVQSSAPASMKLFVSLLSPSAFGIGSLLLCEFESSGSGVQWNNLTQQITGNQIPFGVVLMFLLLDTLLYSLIGLYLDNVIQQEYGVARPWYFLCSTTARRLFPRVCCNPSGRDGVQSPAFASNSTTSSSLQDNKERCYQEGSRSNSHGTTLEPPSQTQRELDRQGHCVKVRKLCKVYAGGKSSGTATVGTTAAFAAVQDMDLTLYEGSITVLLGHNGAGKSTAISCLTGVTPITSGSATIFGYDVSTEMHKIRSMLGVCPQHDVLFPHLTVKEHLLFYGRMKGMSSRKVEAYVNDMIQQVGLVDKMHDISSSLSGGQKRKLSVVIALLGDSKVVFLDEPTSGMDPYSRRSTWELLRAHAPNRVIVLTTHFMDEADILGDYIAIMSRGKLKCAGSPMFLKARYGIGYSLTLVGRKAKHNTSSMVEATMRVGEQGKYHNIDHNMDRNKHHGSDNMQEREDHISSTSNSRPDYYYDPLRVSSFVRESLSPEVSLVTNSGSEMTFRVPFRCSPRFPAFFKALESRMHTDLCIEGYGVSVTTLEEVFMRIASGQEEESRGEPLMTMSQEELGTQEQHQEDSHSTSVCRETTKMVGAAAAVEPPLYTIPGIKEGDASSIFDSNREEGVVQVSISSTTSSCNGATSTTTREEGFTNTSNKVLISPSTAQEVLIHNYRNNGYPPSESSCKEPREYQQRHHNKNTNNMKEGHMDPPPSSLFLPHFRALFLKRYHYSKRDRRSLCCNLLLPVINLTLGLSMLKLFPLQDPPALELSLHEGILAGSTTSMPSHHMVVPYNISVSTNTNSNSSVDFLHQSCSPYAQPVDIPYGIIDNCTGIFSQPIPDGSNLKGMSSWLLEHGRHYSTPLYGAIQVSMASWEDLISFTLFVNSTAHHGPGVFLNYVNDALYSSVVGVKQKVGSPARSRGRILDSATMRNKSCHRSYTSGTREGSSSNMGINNSTTLRTREAAVQGGGPASSVSSTSATFIVRGGDESISTRMRTSGDASSEDTSRGGISAINHPLPYTSRFKGLVDQFQAVQVAINLVTSFSFVAPAIIVLAVKEREVGAKHQQLLCGASVYSYWMASFMWDYCVYLLTFTISMAMIQAFQVPSLQETSIILAIALLLLMYGLAIVPFAYCLSFLFNSHSTAQNVVLFINFLTGLVLMIASFVMSFIESTITVNKSLKYIYRVFPGFCLGNGLLEVTLLQIENEIVTGGVTSPYAWDVLGANLCYLGVETGVFFLLVLGWENRRSLCRTRSRNSSSASSLVDTSSTSAPSTSCEEEDEDVRVERCRVAQKILLLGKSVGSTTTTTGEQEMGSQQDRRLWLNEDAIVLHNLCKVYHGGDGSSSAGSCCTSRSVGGKVALQGLSLGIGKGECFGLLGSNGAGKTTTMKILTGDILPTSGKGYLNGIDVVKDQTAIRRQTGYCSQFDSLLELLTPREHLELYGRLNLIPESQLKRAVDTKLQQMRLTEFRDQPAYTLSGGNKRKLCVAVALMGNPKILFLDEPSTGMDPMNKRFLWDEITRLSCRGGGGEKTTIVLTTHSMEECEALCTSVGIMVHGRLQCIGPIQHLKNKFGQGLRVQITLEIPSRQEVENLQRKMSPSPTSIENPRRGSSTVTSHPATTTPLVVEDGDDTSYTPSSSLLLQDDEASTINHHLLLRQALCDSLGRPDLYTRISTMNILEGLNSVTSTIISPCTNNTPEHSKDLISTSTTRGAENSIQQQQHLLSWLAEWILTEDQRDILKMELSHSFPGISCQEQHDTSSTWHIIDSSQSIGEVFDFFEKRKSDLHIAHYSVTQTTLEQIFLNFAAKDLNNAEA